MKILVDACLTPEWCEILATGGIEAMHVRDIEAASAPDEDIIAWAVENGYSILTHDLDFATMIAAANERRPSIIQIRSKLPIPRLMGPRVIAALSQMSKEIELGAIISIDRYKARVRLLPF